jgi:hypothetical protein
VPHNSGKTAQKAETWPDTQLKWFLSNYKISNSMGKKAKRPKKNQIESS